MSDSQRKLEVAPKAAESKIKRAYTDPLDSSRGGVGGFAETFIRRFKNLAHLILILPLYGIGCLILGAAVAPGIVVFETINSLGTGQGALLKYFMMGTGAAAGYFVYGFALLIVVPVVNFVLRTRLKPWRGPYYSLEAIRWYIHNGATYMARFTFLEFVTPTPFNLWFYRNMGMKIGRGTVINSTWISDPSLIELGKKVTIGGSVTLVGHYGQAGYLVLAPVKIGDGVTIGLKATVMGGVTIGDGAKVMPHSVVMPKTVIGNGETWGGVPARKIDS